MTTGVSLRPSRNNGGQKIHWAAKAKSNRVIFRFDEFVFLGFYWFDFEGMYRHVPRPRISVSPGLTSRTFSIPVSLGHSQSWSRVRIVIGKVMMNSYPTVPKAITQATSLSLTPLQRISTLQLRRNWDPRLFGLILLSNLNHLVSIQANQVIQGIH